MSLNQSKTTTTKKECKVENEPFLTCAGHGPACQDDPEWGNDSREDCLEEVRQRCETYLEDCYAKAKEVTTHTLMRTYSVMTEDGEGRSQGYDPAMAPDRWRDQPQEYDGTAETYPYSSPAFDYGSDETISSLLQTELDSMSDCFQQAIMRCRKEDCYCGLWKFSYTRTTSGVGGTGTPDAETETVDATKTRDASLTTSSFYDIPIEFVITRAFMPGNVMDITDIVEKSYVTTTTTFDSARNIYVKKKRTIRNVYTDLVVGLCAGEIAGVNRVFFDTQDTSIEVSSQPATGDYPLEFHHYKGGAGQKVNSKFAAQHGFGRVPAYRGTAYTHVRNMNLGLYTEFPEMRYEVCLETGDESTSSIQSTVIPGLSTNIWKPIPAANRLVVQTATGIRALNLNTLESSLDYAVTSPIEVTDMGKVLAYQNDDVVLYEPGMLEPAGSYIPGATIDKSWLVRLTDSMNNSGSYLLSFRDGNALMQEIDEVTPAFPNDALGVKVFDNVGATPTAFVPLFVSTTSSRKSLFGVRADGSTLNRLDIVEFRMLSTTPTERLVEDEQFYIHTLTPESVGNVTGIVVRSVVPCEYDGTIVVLYSAGATHYALKWSVSTGVIWRNIIPYSPLGGKDTPHSDPMKKVYSFVSGDNILYTLNTETGAITQAPGTYPAPTGLQYYDSATKSVIYVSGNQITRVVRDRVIPDKESMDTALQRLSRVVGVSMFDTEDVSGLFVTGFRSVELETAAAIITHLTEVYPVRVGVTDRIRVTLLDSLSPAPLTDSQLKKLVISETTGSDSTLPTRVTYFSDDLDGLENVQSFIPVDSTARSADETGATRRFYVLETDEYMLSLAEYTHYTATNAGREHTVEGLPSTLGMASGDSYVRDGETFIVESDTVGSDNSTNFTARRVESKVMVELSNAYRPFTPLSRNSLSTGSPMTVSTRAMNQNYPSAAGMFSGVTNLLNEFTSLQNVTALPGEALTSIGTNKFMPRNTLVWGRLVENNAPLSTAVLRTFRNHSMTLRLPSVAMAQKILNKPALSGSPDPRVRDTRVNAVMIGKELIQYARAEATADPQEVILRDLMRGLQNTDDSAINHIAGTLCVFLDADSCFIEEVPEDLSLKSYKLAASNGVYRTRKDFNSDGSALLPVLPGYAMRLDYETRWSGYLGNRDLKSVLVAFSRRTNYGVGLTDDTVSLFNHVYEDHANYSQAELLYDKGVPTHRPNYTWKMYYLNAEYNEALFNAERDNANSTYIFWRTNDSFNTRARSTLFGGPLLSPMLVAREIPGMVPGVERWFTEDLTANYETRVFTNWKPDVDPLVVVIIATNEFGESRAVYAWPAPYTKYQRNFVRGLNVL